MNEAERLLKKVAEQLEHKGRRDLDVTALEIAELLVGKHWLYWAEDQTLRVNPALYGRLEKR